MKNKYKKIIHVTEEAQKYLLSLNKLDIDNVHIRISVKHGGCSGMSYTMDFENSNHIQQNDQIINYENFQIVCDSKSLLYLYGLSLSYEDKLIGGGFQFINPNAIQTCGCGRSFAT